MCRINAIHGTRTRNDYKKKENNEKNSGFDSWKPCENPYRAQVDQNMMRS